MLEFKKLSFDDIPTLEAYFRAYPSRLCDYTVGGTFMWRDYFRTEIAPYDGALVLKSRYINGKTAFAFPIGKNAESAVFDIADYCRESGTPLCFCTVSESQLGFLRSELGGIAASYNEDWCDYLYDAEQLITLRGHAFNGQRNHINKFKKTYPDWECREITESDAPALVSFMNDYGNSVIKDFVTYKEDNDKTVEVFENYKKYGFCGNFLTVGGKIAALSAGEVCGDTLFVHIEKAHREYEGAYQMMMNLFAGKHAGGEIMFINREEDVGDPGLRTSKQSYHPVGILKKYFVEVKL